MDPSIDLASGTNLLWLFELKEQSVLRSDVYEKKILALSFSQLPYEVVCELVVSSYSIFS
jgi:hypothetical protein